ncbi:MAG: SDR family oxidoreductase, partial [Bacteroidales bacterium]|nr:SDR family oxidoreductase [Bacteroidales bacterium]
FNLKDFVKYTGIQNEESVDGLADLIFKDIKRSENLKSASLVVLSGISSKDWRESFLVNEYLPAHLSELFASHIVDSQIRSGSITLISSSAAYQGAKLPYATTKASLTGVLHVIAKNYKNSIRINLVLPSAFDSGMIADWDDKKRQIVASSNYIGRLGTSDDIAEAILFTVQNKFITNSIINMTGGTIFI